MKWGLFNYFPDAHYRKAEERLLDDILDEEVKPDGGHQIENPHPEELYFWYDPSRDGIVQAEVEPYKLAGVFESEDAAESFVEWYARQYGLDSTHHWELYQAELEYQGNGTFENDEQPEGGEQNVEDLDDIQEPNLDQADFDQF